MEDLPNRRAPKSAVRLELARAIGDVLLLPLRVAVYLVRFRAIVRGVRSDLTAPAASVVDTPPTAARDEPLTIFVSCAEASGETHAVNLVRELRTELAELGAPPARFVGLGGERLRAEDVEILGDPVSKAAMGGDAVRALGFYFELLERAATELRDGRPDVCVVVDSPALHVPLGRIARGYRVPVVHFATPQYWAWAPWRVARYRLAVDLALTILPFEPSWFERHGVPTRHVGHPQLDVLKDVPAASDAGADASGRGRLVLLPGSRGGVIRRNLPWMLAVVERLRATCPDVEVVIPHDRDDAAATIEAVLAEHRSGAASPIGDVRLAAGDLHGELARARIALAVSGTVLLDLLHHRIPTVSVYRIDRAVTALLRPLVLLTPWFSSVNLLAGREVVPEHAFRGDGPLVEVADRLARWYKDPEARAGTRRDLEVAAQRLGPPGAARRAARAVLSMVTMTSTRA